MVCLPSITKSNFTSYKQKHSILGSRSLKDFSLELMANDLFPELL